MRVRKVVVTGASGFVGSHVVDALLARGCEVRAVARRLAPAQAQGWFERVEFVAADIHDPQLDVGALCDGADALVHLAWPGLPNYRGLFHLEHNLMADYAFIKRAVEAGVARVQVSGTCLEYGQHSGALSETLSCQPDTPYGLAKHSLHLFLETLREQMPFALQWVRLFYLHGRGQNPSSLLAALDRAIDSGQTRFDMSGGEQLRDFLPIERAAGYLANLLQHDFSGTVNCCSGQPVSVRRLVEAHCAARGVEMALNLGHYPYPTYEPMAFWGDASRLQALLGAEHEA
ncbi:epimerase [Pseudomonas sp. SDI]|uniref:NAD-dependent epimerase/dehydratase family protein n=1 Tax=Pseudomonas sp. SDI TaxID=2170734 RepID=UPI000DE658FB|nr:NAD(P)-dependent oxidoreductase [Pseudomonas sp. SDI]PWB33558.1 epimerase [Pseudomonas sp. SDI]